jgi:hypothetical protein
LRSPTRTGWQTGSPHREFEFQYGLGVAGQAGPGPSRLKTDYGSAPSRSAITTGDLNADGRRGCRDRERRIGLGDRAF